MLLTRWHLGQRCHCGIEKGMEQGQVTNHAMPALMCLLQNVVEPKAAVVREEEAKAQEKADAAKAIKDECETDLAEVSSRLNISSTALLLLGVLGF